MTTTKPQASLCSTMPKTHCQPHNTALTPKTTFLQCLEHAKPAQSNPFSVLSKGLITQTGLELVTFRSASRLWITSLAAGLPCHLAYKVAIFETQALNFWAISPAPQSNITNKLPALLRYFLTFV